MIVNSAASFDALYPDDLLARIVAMVESAWQSMTRPSVSDTENVISLALLIAIRAEKKRIGGMPFQVHREVWQDPVMVGSPSFRTDIQFIQGPDEEVYFAFEAKRLNVFKQNGGVRSDAQKYVQEGMYRYVDSCYAGGLPSGGMIGYVMDGDIPGAITAVSEKVKTFQIRLQMPVHQVGPSKLNPTNACLRQTDHVISGGSFALHHLFLAV